MRKTTCICIIKTCSDIFIHILCLKEEARAAAFNRMEAEVGNQTGRGIRYKTFVITKKDVGAENVKQFILTDEDRCPTVFILFSDGDVDLLAMSADTTIFQFSERKDVAWGILIGFCSYFVFDQNYPEAYEQCLLLLQYKLLDVKHGEKRKSKKPDKRITKNFGHVLHYLQKCREKRGKKATNV